MQSQRMMDAVNRLVDQSPPIVQRALELAHFDPEPTHVQPTRSRLVTATIVAVVLSLVADAVLVGIGVKLFPSTRGYVHFRFSDYAKLTIIGVLIACAGWPIITRLTAWPKWLFARLAVLVSLVLFLPDAWLLYQHQSPRAVAVLAAMHVAIAIVTYCALVYLAPVRKAEHIPTHAVNYRGGRQAPVPTGRRG